MSNSLPRTMIFLFGIIQEALSNAKTCTTDRVSTVGHRDGAVRVPTDNGIDDLEPLRDPGVGSFRNQGILERSRLVRRGSGPIGRGRARKSSSRCRWGIR